MEQKKNIFLPPLFDRLDETSPELFTEELVKESIEKELNMMLDTRCFFSLKKQSAGPETAYLLPEILGLIDLSFFADNDPHWTRLTQYLKEYISLLEPRIENPRVEILQFNTHKQELSFNLWGTIRFGNRVEHVTFPLYIH